MKIKVEFIEWVQILHFWVLFFPGIKYGCAIVALFVSSDACKNTPRV